MHNLYTALDSGTWAATNPAKCPCRGGWLLSDYDTWHKCPLHGQGVPHPEDVDGWENFDRKAWSLQLHRAAWREFQERSGLDREPFRKVVEDLVDDPKTPSDWVNAAEKVSNRIVTERLEAKAKAAGYACRLEAALTDAGRAEAEARASGHPDPEGYGVHQTQEWYP